MPDRKKETELGHLEGVVSKTSSSDAFVASTAAGLKNEIDGLNGKVLQYDQDDVYEPKPITGTTQTKPLGTSVVRIIGDAGNLKPDESPLGLHIWRSRNARNQKKAA